MRCPVLVNVLSSKWQTEDRLNTPAGKVHFRNGSNNVVVVFIPSNDQRMKRPVRFILRKKFLFSSFSFTIIRINL